MIADVEHEQRRGGEVQGSRRHHWALFARHRRFTSEERQGTPAVCLYGAVYVARLRFRARPPFAGLDLSSHPPRWWRR